MRNERTNRLLLWHVVVLLQSIYAVVWRISLTLKPGAAAGIGLTASTYPKGATDLTVIAKYGIEDVLFTAQPIDSEGNPRTALLSWTSSDPAVCSLSVHADTLGARGVTAGAGAAVITVTDGDVTATATVLVQVPNRIELTAAAVAKP